MKISQPPKIPKIYAAIDIGILKPDCVPKFGHIRLHHPHVNETLTLYVLVYFAKALHISINIIQTFGDGVGER